MGIKGLMKLINEHAPGAVKSGEIKNYFGRKIAIDASMCLYQFLIAVRAGPDAEVLTNENGEVTSHLQGMFHRTIRMLDQGIKPVFVFDGKPPVLKQGELDKRKERREENEQELKEALENDGDQEDINKYQKRLVKVTKEHNEETRKLLRLMGVPIIESPSEAEAQCAALVKLGLVYATATEDMDALTFGSNKLLRNLTAAQARKLPVLEIDLQQVLNKLELTMDQFIDLCVLLGCDYTTTIRGVGPQKAFKMIQEHKTIEEGLKHLEARFTKPDDFLYSEAAELFKAPDVINDPEKLQLVWGEPDEEGILQFLVDEKGFNRELVLNALKRLKGARQKASQQRMDSFFKALPAAPKEEKKEDKESKKRKEPPGAKAAGLKKKQAPASSSKKK